MPNKLAFNQPLPDVKKSLSLLTRAEGLIPAKTQTLAKGPGQYSLGISPAYISRGLGARVWDVDGNEYLDYSMGVGPVSLGYRYHAVDDAIRRQLDSGITFSLMHPLEVEVAELIRNVIPNAESVRFSKTGADATTAAVRLARAFTGKNKVVCCGYHGWHDWYIAVTDRNSGIPGMATELTHTFAYNDLASVHDAIDEDTACIILEPMVFEEPRDGFLHELRALCDQREIILIFDEMWTGFRLALGGAQEYFGVRADLCTFSKAVANGMPISLLTGRHDIMKLCEKDVFFFTTFGGEALSLAATKATIEELRDKQVLPQLHKKGKWLQENLNELLASRKMGYLKCIGAPVRTMLSITPGKESPLVVKTYIQQELLRHGILWTGFHTMSHSHTMEDLEFTLRAYGEVLARLDHIIESGAPLETFLNGMVLEPVFRRTTNFNMKPRVAPLVGA